MSKTIIISVGTSVITNYNRNGRKDKKEIVRLIEEFEDAKDINDINNTVLKDAKVEIAKRLNKCKNKIESKNNLKEALLDTSAEIHSLYKYYKIPENVPADGEKDKIILLCTDTPDSLLSAQIIRDEVLTKWDFFKEKCEMTDNRSLVDEEGIKTIKNLNFNNPENWVLTKNNQLVDECGLGKLRQFFRNLLNTYNRNELLVVRTGGFKEFSADLKLFSFSHAIPSIYLFENSSKFIETKPYNAIGDFVYEAFIS